MNELVEILGKYIERVECINFGYYFELKSGSLLNHLFYKLIADLTD